MRIRHIRIAYWRHFENLELKLEEDSKLICVVGANGTGKSHLLELIGCCAHQFGLSHGIDLPRGNPFADEHDLSLQFFIASSSGLEAAFGTHPAFASWDRTLNLRSQRRPDGNHEISIEAGGVENGEESIRLAGHIVSVLQTSQSVHFLSLDADRAYPKRNLNISEVAQAYEIDWTGLAYTRGRSFKSTTTLYDEWLKYFLAQENQAGSELLRRIRQARQASEREPVFEDHFLSYKEALQKVLPHIVFVGVDQKTRRLLFDTTGLELSFDQLSGGEREIVFLIGQIDRFGLRDGLFLLDEPELHLNADLIRKWVNYLASTIETGQVWLATHSLEAVEAAGQRATFVLERSEDTRKVAQMHRLDRDPILSALSRAVGTPAFSVSRLVFVFIEGEEKIGERERFRKMVGVADHVRFIESGSCNEVLRRVTAMKALAAETETGIRIGGIVDGDFSMLTGNEENRRGQEVCVLGVHEVENLFLHPATLDVVLRQNGRSHLITTDLIRSSADKRAGSWVFQYACATRNARDLPAINSIAKEWVKGLTWEKLSRNSESEIAEIVNRSGYQAHDQDKFATLLKVGVQNYSRKRVEEGLWKVCEGKQVVNDVAREMGFSGWPALSDAVLAAWNGSNSVLPEELITLRNYITRL